MNKSKGAIHAIISRLIGDAKELLKNINKSNPAEKKEKKPLNVWTVAFFLTISILVFLLVLPMFAGIFSIVFQEADSDMVGIVSQEGLTGLIIVAAALGAFVLWFAAHSKTDESNKTMIKYTGKLFLCSALALSLFMLLSPVLPDVREAVDLYSNFIKAVTAGSIIIGSFTFALADVFGLVYLFKF